MSASDQTVTHTSQSDFTVGSSEDTVDINASPGDITLKHNRNTTTDADFSAGRWENVNGNGHQITLNNIFTYSTTSTPAIGGNTVRFTMHDATNNTIYAATEGGGLSAIDTKGTFAHSDDTLAITYSTTSTPALAHNNVWHNTVDAAHTTLYVATSSGLSAINTQGTTSGADDSLLKRYDNSGASNVRFIPNNTVNYVMYDSPNNLIYVGTAGGMSVINTQGTTNAADDVMVGTYMTSGSLPSGTPNIAHNDVYHIWRDSSRNLLYVSTYGGGLSIINTQGTLVTTDDTLVKTYNTSTTPALGSNYLPGGSYLDTTTNFLYINTDNGLTVINTQGTVSTADDTLVITYNTTSTPSIADNYVRYSYLDPSSNYLYLGEFYKGLQVIDTKGTTATTDDAIITNVSTSTTPSLPNNTIRAIWRDPTNNATYLGTGLGLAKYAPSSGYDAPGTYIGTPFSLLSTPHEVFTWDQTATSAHTVTGQVRYGDGNAAWIDEFNDGNASNYLGDYNGWGYTFNTAVESNGTLKLSNPNPGTSSGQWVDFVIGTGKPANFFPLNSIVTARVRINSETRQRPSTWTDYMYNDDWWDDNGGEVWQNNEWIVTRFLADSKTFSTVGFEPVWSTGTWSSTDTFEIDWLKIELPDSYWGSWGATCTNNYNCPLTIPSGQEWIQYRLNLSTTNSASTPIITQTAFSSQYQSNGTYTSATIDAGGLADWHTLTAENTILDWTAISYWTRTGNTASPDATWSEWQQLLPPIESPNARYLQYKAILSSSQVDKTPRISSIGIGYTTIDPTPTPTTPLPTPTPDLVAPTFTLKKIGSVTFSSAHSTFYYTTERPLFFGVGEQGSIITLKIDGVVHSTKPTINTNGEWSISDASFTVSSHNLEFTATDAAGNSAIINFMLIIDPNYEGTSIDAELETPASSSVPPTSTTSPTPSTISLSSTPRVTISPFPTVDQSNTTATDSIIPTLTKWVQNHLTAIVSVIVMLVGAFLLMRLFIRR